MLSFWAGLLSEGPDVYTRARMDRRPSRPRAHADTFHDVCFTKKQRVLLKRVSLPAWWGGGLLGMIRRQASRSNVWSAESGDVLGGLPLRYH